MSDHGCDQLRTVERQIIQCQCLIFGFIVAHQFTRFKIQRRQNLFQLCLAGRGLQLFNNFNVQLVLLKQCQRLARLGAMWIVEYAHLFHDRLSGWFDGRFVARMVNV